MHRTNEHSLELSGLPIDDDGATATGVPLRVAGDGKQDIWLTECGDVDSVCSRGDKALLDKRRARQSG